MIGADRRLRGVWMMVCAVAIAFLGTPSGAQDGTGPAPENAQDRRYGSGWDCDPGYRVDDGICVGLGLPENAYPTGRSHGSGWACRRGFRAVAGACVAVPVPDNAYLDVSGLSWECERGFRKQGASCVVIEVPDNAFLSNRGIGTGWECERGHVAQAGACVALVLPDNAHLDRTGHRWQCDRGFQVSEDGRCVLSR